MTLSEIRESFPLKYIPEIKIEDKTLSLEGLTVTDLGDRTYFLDGYSDFVDLPHKFIFGDDHRIISVLVPFILQAIDGEQRI